MRLIDADALTQNKPEEYIDGTRVYFQYEIDNAQTVTPDKIQAIMSDYLVCRCEPQRPQGEWIGHSTYKDVLICSICKHGSNQVYNTFNFCPNCGADMRGEK